MLMTFVVFVSLAVNFDNRNVWLNLINCLIGISYAFDYDVFLKYIVFLKVFWKIFTIKETFIIDGHILW